MSCLFCKIAAGEIPAKIAYETEHVVAFHDVNPQAPTHVLVIPRAHVANLSELTVEPPLATELLTAVQAVARSTGVVEGGYRTVVNTGKDAGQSVFHLHFHVLGGRPLAWPPG